MPSSVSMGVFPKRHHLVGWEARMGESWEKEESPWVHDPLFFSLIKCVYLSLLSLSVDKELEHLQSFSRGSMPVTLQWSSRCKRRTRTVKISGICIDMNSYFFYNNPVSEGSIYSFFLAYYWSIHAGKMVWEHELISKKFSYEWLAGVWHMSFFQFYSQGVPDQQKNSTPLNQAILEFISHIHTHIRTHTYTHVCTHPHIGMHTHSHTHMHAHMYTHTHANTHTHMHARAHTHSYLSSHMCSPTKLFFLTPLDLWMIDKYILT